MMIGDLIGLAGRSTSGFSQWIEAEDPSLVLRCRTAAGGQSLDMWVRGTITWFELHASGDDWATLTSRVRESTSPGHALLATMVERRLSTGDYAAKGHAA